MRPNTGTGLTDSVERARHGARRRPAMQLEPGSGVLATGASSPFLEMGGQRGAMAGPGTTFRSLSPLHRTAGERAVRLRAACRGWQTSWTLTQAWAALAKGDCATNCPCMCVKGGLEFLPTLELPWQTTEKEGNDRNLGKDWGGRRAPSRGQPLAQPRQSMWHYVLVWLTASSMSRARSSHALSTASITE